MARIHTVWTGDESGLVDRLRPRDDVLVREELAGSHPGSDVDVPSPSGEVTLDGVEGPFLHYRRTLR
ncbi:MAG: hypothetical protein ACYC2O_06115, partial [Microthrixaceae bacterium]